MGRYIDFLHQRGGGEDARAQELLRQPPMAGLAPLQSPTVADQDRPLSVDGPMADRDYSVANARVPPLRRRPDRPRLARWTVEGPREHQEDDHRPPLVHLANDLIERGAGFLAV